MQRIAAPMVGGRVSATLLTLIVIPALYSWVLSAQTFWPNFALKLRESPFTYVLDYFLAV